MTTKTNKMNPDITTSDIGIINLRTITIYPLSVANQLDATDLIIKVVNGMSSLDKIDDEAVVKTFIDLVGDNIQKILNMVTSEGEVIDFAELTNTQLLEIVQKIYEINYKDVSKNLKDLIQKMQPLLASMRSQQPLSEKPVIK